MKKWNELSIEQRDRLFFMLKEIIKLEAIKKYIEDSGRKTIYKKEIDEGEIMHTWTTNHIPYIAPSIDGYVTYSRENDITDHFICILIDLIERGEPVLITNTDD